MDHFSTFEEESSGNKDVILHKDARHTMEWKLIGPEVVLKM